MKRERGKECFSCFEMTREMVDCLAIPEREKVRCTQCPSISCLVVSPTPRGQQYSSYTFCFCLNVRVINVIGTDGECGEIQVIEAVCYFLFYIVYVFKTLWAAFTACLGMGWMNGQYCSFKLIWSLKRNVLHYSARQRLEVVLVPFVFYSPLREEKPGFLTVRVHKVKRAFFDFGKQSLL